MINVRANKGITLVALIITVIILLILAGVTLSILIGENGMITKSKQGVEKYKDKSTDEQWQLEDFEAGMEEISLAELEDEEKHPQLKAMKLEIKVEEGNETIQLPVYTYEYEDYKYDFEVDWGDESEKQKVTNENLNSATHTYVPGIYTITINGEYESLYINESIKKSLMKVTQWGATGLQEVR